MKNFKKLLLTVSALIGLALYRDFHVAQLKSIQTINQVLISVNIKRLAFFLGKQKLKSMNLIERESKTLLLRI